MQTFTTLAYIGGFVSRTTNSAGMLDPEDLRDVDEALVGYLREGRVTPAYARQRLINDDFQEYSRGYVQQRLARLEEHSHAENLFGVGLYELRSDPREEDSE